MQLTDNDIDIIDRLVADHSEQSIADRIGKFSNLVAAMTVIHGKDQTAAMLHNVANEIDSGGSDQLHEAFVMRMEMFRDLGEL